MQILSVCVHEGNKDMFCCKENLSIYLLVQYPTILPLIAFYLLTTSVPLVTLDIPNRKI